MRLLEDVLGSVGAQTRPGAASPGGQPGQAIAGSPLQGALLTLLGQLAQVLPQVIDRLTPTGQAPAGAPAGASGGFRV